MAFDQAKLQLSGGEPSGSDGERRRRGSARGKLGTRGPHDVSLEPQDELSEPIIKANPDMGLYNTHGSQGGGRSALTVAAERGDLEVLEVVYEGAVKARGEAFARQFLSAGAERGQTPLMRACVFGTSHHVECVGYLLKKGADPFAETEKGETCLHLAAKNAYTDCLSEILSARVSIGGGPLTRLADVKLPYTPPVKFVDMRNAAGFTPLHLATLKNSPAAMQVLLGAGASMDAGISDAGNTPHLAKGSTALHIAAARGSQPCCSVLLDFQSSVPDVDLRSIRNARGLKASQLARLAGHDGLALVLSERQGLSVRRGRGGRRRRRNRDALHTAGGGPRPATSPDAVLGLLVQRAKLLLALREVGLELDCRDTHEGGIRPAKAALLAKSKDDSAEEKEVKDDVAAAVAEFTELWRKGELGVASNRAGSLLSALTPADAAVPSLPEEMLGDGDGGEDSFAAAAMVQAALNAMAYFSPVAKPLDLPPTELKPTSPIAAAMVVQAAIRKLAGKSATQNTMSATALLQSIAQTAQPVTPTSGSAEGAALGTATPQQADPRPRHRHAPGLLHTTPLPTQRESPAGTSGTQVQRIVSKARRRQKRNALRDAGLAAPDQEPGEIVVESSAKSSDSLGGFNPLMDNPLFPTADASIGPGERRRALLLKAALQTAPAGSDFASSSRGDGARFGSPPALRGRVSVPEPPTPPAAMSTPFAERAKNDAELPPVFPWESYMAPGGPAPVASVIKFSNNMPSSRLGRTALHHQHGKTAAAAPKTPAGADSKSGAATESPHEHLAQARPAGRLRTATHEAMPASRSESLVSGTSSRRLRADASDALSMQSGATPDSRTSRLLRTDSMEYTPSLTPQVTPQASGTLLSQDSSSDSGHGEDGEDSEDETKGDLDMLKNDNRCAICMDQPLQVGIATCEHQVCYGCAYQLCSRGLSPPICPFCRGSIKTFTTSDTPDKRAGHRA